MSRYTATLFAALMVVSAICEPMDSGATASTTHPKKAGVIQNKHKKKPTTRYLQKKNNKASKPKWLRYMQATFSPDRKTVAVFDGKKIFLSNPERRNIRYIRIKLLEGAANEILSASFKFRHDGKRLAVLTTLQYGEPLVCTDEKLLSVDVSTGRYRILKEWEYDMLGRGPVTADRKLLKWSADGKSIVLIGTVYNGIEMPSDAKVIGTKVITVKDTPSLTSSIVRDNMHIK
jgi:hypothetical protein